MKHVAGKPLKEIECFQNHCTEPPGKEGKSKLSLQFEI